MALSASLRSTTANARGIGLVFWRPLSLPLELNHLKPRHQSMSRCFLLSLVAHIPVQIRLQHGALVGVLLAWLSGPIVAADSVAVMLSEPGGAYAEVLEAMREEARGSSLEMVEATNAEALQRLHPRVAVAVGVHACLNLARNQSRVPLVCTLLPRAAFESIAEELREQGPILAAQTLDQPLARQLDLIRISLPGRKHVGVLLGPDSAGNEPALRALAVQRGLHLVVGRVSSAGELPLMLQQLLAESDLLLALPDRLVFNSGTIQNVLRATLQKRIPVIGFSPAYVRAGATLALYATPTMVGSQTTRLLRRVLASGSWPPVQFPADFEIGVNRAVARSLGLDLPDPATLREQLLNLGGYP